MKVKYYIATFYGGLMEIRPFENRKEAKEHFRAVGKIKKLKQWRPRRRRGLEHEAS